MQQWSANALSVILPAECLVCGTVTAGNAKSGQAAVCVSCHDLLTAEQTDICDTCGAPLGPHVSSSGNCPHCRGRRLRFRSVTCLGVYEDPLKTMLLAGKWSPSTLRIRTLARILSRARIERLQSRNIDRIIPIPQIWYRRLIRNFNPAEVIARELAFALRKPIDVHVLRRSRGTRPQKRVSLSSRGDNQKGSFRIRDRHVIRGDRILLVDDVLTTGATCSEASALLRKNGARECHVAVLARVLDHSA